MTVTLVQHASATAAFTSGTTGTIAPAFASNTTAGNLIVACFTGAYASGSLGVSSVTTNGAADSWANALSMSRGNFYINPATAGGQKIVDVNLTFSTATTSFSVVALADIFEVAGLGTSVAVDQSSATLATTTSWSSGTTAATTQANEIWFGCTRVDVTALNTTATLTGPSSPWVNESALQVAIQNGGTGATHSNNVYQMAGYQIPAATGTATYAGTVSASGSASSGVLALMSASRLPRPQPRSPVAVFRASSY